MRGDHRAEGPLYPPAPRPALSRFLGPQDRGPAQRGGAGVSASQKQRRIFHGDWRLRSTAASTIVICNDRFTWICDIQSVATNVCKGSSPADREPSADRCL